MFGDLLFIENPREKRKKNFYINERNYYSRSSIQIRNKHKNFYNNSILLRKIENIKKPMPKVLYSTAQYFYHYKANQFIKKQKENIKEIIDIMNNFSDEINDEEKNDEFFVTHKNSKLTRNKNNYKNRIYKTEKQKLFEDLDFAKASNIQFYNEKCIQNDSNTQNNKSLKDNLIFEKNFGKYKFSRNGLYYPNQVEKNELPKYSKKYSEDEEYFNFLQKVKNPQLIYNKISNFDEKFNQDLEKINKTYGTHSSRTRFTTNPILNKFLKSIPIYDIYKDLKIIENRYVGSKFKYKLLPLYNKKLSNLDKLADKFYKEQNKIGNLKDLIKIENCS